MIVKTENLTRGIRTLALIFSVAGHFQPVAISDCEARVTGAGWSLQPQPGKLHGNDHPLPVARSCAGLRGLDRIQIRSEFVAGNTGCALDRQHPKRWNLVPLRYCLFGDAQGRGEFGKTADVLDGTFQSCV